MMPQLGETVTEGTITKWMKAVGDEVARDEPLFEVSTDKVDSEVPSPAAGVLSEILVPEGETVEVGVKLAVIGDGAGASGGGGAPATETVDAPPPPRGRGASGRRTGAAGASATCPRRPRAPLPTSQRGTARPRWSPRRTATAAPPARRCCRRWCAASSRRTGSTNPR